MYPLADIRSHIRRIIREIADAGIRRVEDLDGNVQYFNSDGRLHRNDGPAVVLATGETAWYVDGKRHRLDGPAVEHADGGKDWYVDGLRHRLDGPAYVRSNGDAKWFVRGNILRPVKTVVAVLHLSDEEQIAAVHRDVDLLRKIQRAIKHPKQYQLKSRHVRALTDLAVKFDELMAAGELRVESWMK